MILRERVDCAAYSDHVVGPSPAYALDREAGGKAGVDIGEGHDLGLAVVPAPAAEQADVVGQRLFEVEDVTIFDAARAGLRDVEIEGRVVQRLAIAAGKGAVQPSDGAQLARLR